MYTNVPNGNLFILAYLISNVELGASGWCLEIGVYGAVNLGHPEAKLVAGPVPSVWV